MIMGFNYLIFNCDIQWFIHTFVTYKHSVHSINLTNVGGITKLLTWHKRLIAILSFVYFVQYLLLYTVQITRERTYVSAVYNYNYSDHKST